MDMFKKIAFASALTLTFAIQPAFATTAPTKAPTDTKTSAPAPAKLTSAEIGTLATIAAIDKSEILVSVVASNKKASSGVEDFAKMMINMHGDNLTQILQMASTLHGLPLKGGESDAIKADNTKLMDKLGGLDGDQFDKAYVDAMVTGHQGALNLIDTKLMKTAKTDEMKKFVADTRAVVVQHLEDAKKLQSQMQS